MADKDAEVLKALLPAVGIGTVVVIGIAVLGRLATGRGVYQQDGQYLVSVRDGQWHDLRDFVQPDNPDVLAVYSQIGPDAWQLLDFVCSNISYRRDIGEFWQTPSETISRGQGDCEDCSILLTSLIRAGGAPNCYVALGSLGGYGHAWVAKEGQIYETTYTSACPVPDPMAYEPMVMFNDIEVFELYPGALDNVFKLRRNEATKLNLMARALEVAHGKQFA